MLLRNFNRIKRYSLSESVGKLGVFCACMCTCCSGVAWRVGWGRCCVLSVRPTADDTDQQAK